MKQVSNAIKSFVLSSPRHHSIPQRKAFSNYHLFSLLAGFVMFISGCQKQDHKNKCVPFTGNFTFVIETSTGTGTASHIGRFTLVEPNNIVTPNAEGFLDVTGPATITAANGDEIYATHVGIIQPLGNGTAQVNGKFTITGGTGKFAGATGSFEVQGLSNLALGTGSYTFEGTICY